MLKITRTAALSLALVAAAQGAQLRTRVAAETRLAVGDQALIETLADKYNCADTSKSLSTHLEDIRQHAQDKLSQEISKCDSQATEIANKRGDAAEHRDTLMEGECTAIDGRWPMDDKGASCTQRKDDLVAAAQEARDRKVKDYNERKQGAKRQLDETQGPKEQAEQNLATLFGKAKSAENAVTTEVDGPEGLRKQLADALKGHEATRAAQVDALGRDLVKFKDNAAVAETQAKAACDAAHTEVVGFANGEQGAIDEIEKLVAELKACSDHSDTPAVKQPSLLEVAAKTQDRTQAKCALARAELRRQLTAHAASSFLQEPFETASFDGLTRKDAIGFDRDRSSGNVQYAADGSVAKWRQAVQDEITKAHSEKEQCYQRAESAKTAADEAASKHEQKAINEAMAKETADKAASEGEFNPQIQEFIRAAADTAKAYSDAKDAFDSVNPPGPYVKYLNAKQEYDDIVAETIGSPPVGKLEYYQNEFNAAESAAGAAYTQDRQAFEDAVRSEFVQRDTALAAQDTEQKAECSAIQEEIKIELNKVAEIVSKVSSLTMI